MRYVIIGAGAAGISAAGKIRELDREGTITVISADEAVYSRCMLHHVISEKRPVDSIGFVAKDFFEKNAITWLKGRSVTGVDFPGKQVVLDVGEALSYDKLLIAAGSKASVPPVKGLVEAKNVFTLRDLGDALAIKNAAQGARNAVVLGAGLVGLDAASALMARGLQVTVVEQAARVLPLQLDRQAAQSYQEAFENAGATVRTGVSVTEGIPGADGKIQALTLADGTLLPCELVVAAAGVRPNLSFIQPGTLAADRGITVDDRMQTSVPDVFAAGDVTGLSAIWPNAVKEGVAAAYNMVGQDKQYDDYFTSKNSISLLGLDTVSIGLTEAPDDSYTTETSRHNGVYKKMIFKDGVVSGVILQKEISRSGFWTQVIKNKLRLDLPTDNPFKVSYADFYTIDNRASFSYAHK